MKGWLAGSKVRAGVSRKSASESVVELGILHGEGKWCVQDLRLKLGSCEIGVNMGSFGSRRLGAFQECWLNCGF